MTREEIAAIDRECEEQHLSQQDYLDSHGIARLSTIGGSANIVKCR